MTLAATSVLAAVESFFGMGVTVAPMPDAVDGHGATLFRYLPAMDDPCAGGLHLDDAPTAVTIDRWLSTWQAFDAPGCLRWVQPEGALVDPTVLEAVASAGYEARPRRVGALEAGGPPDLDGVAVAEITGDVRDWAAFEVLARWIDPDEDPGRWRWRANRVRHLVEGGRGRAFLARTPAMPVGAAVALDAPDHRPGAASAAGVVVHRLHRANGIAGALCQRLATRLDRPGVLLGPRAATGGLVEVGRRVAPRPARG